MVFPLPPHKEERFKMEQNEHFPFELNANVLAASSDSDYKLKDYTIMELKQVLTKAKACVKECSELERNCQHDYDFNLDLLNEMWEKGAFDIYGDRWEAVYQSKDKSFKQSFDKLSKAKLELKNAKKRLMELSREIASRSMCEEILDSKVDSDGVSPAAQPVGDNLKNSMDDDYKCQLKRKESRALSDSNAGSGDGKSITAQLSDVNLKQSVDDDDYNSQLKKELEEAEAEVSRCKKEVKDARAYCAKYEDYIADTISEAMLGIASSPKIEQAKELYDSYFRPMWEKEEKLKHAKEKLESIRRKLL